MLRRLIPTSVPHATHVTAAVAPIVHTPKRRLHVAAAGSFNAFNEQAAVERLSEPTMLSTLLSRREAMKANPSLRNTLRMLNRAGHRVQFGLDATRLDDPSYAPVAAMAVAARKHNIDMRKMEVSFLRSNEETPDADRNLLRSFAVSARRSGVQKLKAFHSRNIYKQWAHGAPTEDDWLAAATAAGYRRVRTGTDPHARLVESVPRPGGTVQRVPLKPDAAGFSEFEP